MKEKTEMIMNYRQAMEYMEGIACYGSVMGLDNIRRLLAALGDPQKELKFVHVAGTNGKGSVLAYLSSVLKCGGYRVGRYSSPAVFSYQEKIQVNGVPISKKDLVEELERIRAAIERITAEGGGHPTPFEVETALAFLHFWKKQCDIVVLETGLGGAEDATNVVTDTLAAVFSSISMDHMAFLGDTLEKIAVKKAGIIKNGCYVISTRQQEEAMQILREACRKKDCGFRMADATQVRKKKYGLEKQSFSYKSHEAVEIKMAGKWQIDNAVLALEVLDALAEKGFLVTERQLKKGMLDARWPGRFSVIGKKPFFITDGAHNADAAKKLAESIRFYFTNKKIVFIMGILKDKDYEKIIEETAGLAEQIITVTAPGNARAMSAYGLAQAVREYNPCVTAADSLQEAVEMAYLLAGKDAVIVAFGSLSYLGELTDIVKNRDRIRRDTHGKSEKS